jgi:hypothetical protein
MGKLWRKGRQVDALCANGYVRPKRHTVTALIMGERAFSLDCRQNYAVDPACGAAIPRADGARRNCERPPR